MRGVSAVRLLVLPMAALQDSRIALQLDAAQPERALSIIEMQGRGEEIPDANWKELFATAGYQRLKQREKEMGRELVDAEFQTFLLARDRFDRRAALAATLAELRQADLTAAATRVLAYLPAEAKIHATVFPVIKPQANSFVFEPATNPAVFLFVDPAVTKEQFENTVAHELHHIGFASLPDRPPASSAAVESVLHWASAFGEGFAMLAAAGGPDVHPHACSKPEDRARWDRDLANFDADLKKVETFFLDLLDHRLKTPAEINQAGYAFFGVQGPWYTVGWKMAVTVEKRFGRGVLISGMRQPDRLLATFNEAALQLEDEEGTRLETWSQDLLDRIGAKPLAP